MDGFCRAQARSSQKADSGFIADETGAAPE